MFDVKLTGFDEVIKKFDDIGKRANKLNGQQQISFEELFPNAFMSTYTNFLSLKEMFDTSGFKIESQEDFKNIPDKPWDQFIKSGSQFENWQNMIDIAVREWTVNRLGL